MSSRLQTSLIACALAGLPLAGCRTAEPAQAQARVEAVALSAAGGAHSPAGPTANTTATTPAAAGSAGLANAQKTAPAAARAAPEPAAPVSTPVPTPASTQALAQIAADALAALHQGDHPLARPIARTAAQWVQVLAAVPELAAHSAQFAPVTPRQADEALARAKRSRSNVTAWTLADGPFTWSPTHDAVFVVLAGSVAQGALISVLEPTPAGGLRHVASLVLAEQDAPLAIAYDAARPTELLWTTCYGCPGEGGSIRLGDDGRPVFVYR